MDFHEFIEKESNVYRRLKPKKRDQNLCKKTFTK